MKSVMQAAILIGGKGTRLGAAVADTPKPLLTVEDRPFIEHVMRNLRRFGFTDFLLLAGYRADVVDDRYGSNSAFAEELDATVTVIVEPQPLGTAGALKHAASHLNDTFLLVNGDSIFDFNYLDLCCCESADEPQDWLARVALLPVENATRYGFVDFDGTCIKAFREKPPAPESGLINSGVYWIRKGLLDDIPTTPCSLEQDIFPAVANAGRLTGRSYTGFFIDIGIPQDLERARTSLSVSLQKPAAFLDRDGTLNHDAGYTHRIDEFHWMQDAVAAIRCLNDAGYLVFVVTNQAGIARGFYRAEDVDKLHAFMNADLAASGAHIDDFRYCPHHPEGSIPALSKTCECRKPATGMLDSLVCQWQPDLGRSFMLGDMEKDVLAGEAAGLESALVNPGELLNAVKQRLQR